MPPKKPSPNSGKASLAGEAFEGTHGTDKRSNFRSTPTSKQTKFATIWNARITPGPRKLILLALAKYGDADGRNCRPAVATLADDCGMAPSSARTHLHQLVQNGFLAVTKPAGQWSATTYAVNLQALAAISRFSPPEFGDLSKESRPPESGAQETLRAPDFDFRAPDFDFRAPDSGADPNDPKDPSLLGREGAVPSGRASPSLGTGPGVVLPKEMDAGLFEQLVQAGPVSPGRVQALVQKALELVAGGHDENALALQALERGWKSFPLPPRAKPYPGAEKRSSGRKTASVDAKTRARSLGDAWGDR